ncbi:beta-propeller domain-containing protein [Mycobacterium sp. NBC_00419]|uniref:beta-propeller domain-containing protein n=1 Tax=Mycobacterium sp. NBC_00419 TaxID=2975989 RepID=UPI002E24A113
MAGKRGARVGAAAFALGLSLAGPQGLAVATAATGDDDSSSASAGTSSDTGSAAHSAAGRHAPRGNASSGSSGGGGSSRTTSVTRPRAAAPARRIPIALTPAQTTEPAAASTETSPAAAQTVPARIPVARTGRPSGGLTPAIPDQMIALKTEFGRLIDIAANQLNGLPASPITEFLQGALSLIRRGLSLPTTVAPGGTYFTEQQLRDYLLALAKQRYEGLFGQTVPVYDYGYPWLFDVAYLKSTGVVGTVSDTNTQVDGVDEADFVETDGHYIYIAHNGELKIVGADTNVVSTVTLSGNVVGQFLSGNRLTVITQSGSGWCCAIYAKPAGPFAPWGGWNPQTTVTVYDIADPTAPTAVTRRVYDGAYRDARSVDGVVHVVLDASIKLPEPLYTDTPVKGGPVEVSPAALTDLMIRWGGNPTVVANRTYETWDSYAARVAGSIVSTALPHAYSIDANGTVVDLGVLTKAGQIVRPKADFDQSLVTVVSIDSAHTLAVTAGAGGATAMVAPTGGTVYMTRDGLYLATSNYTYTDSGSSSDTRIDRFAVAGTSVKWQAGAVVAGTLINQFALDEYDGHLRVATHTTSSAWGNGSWTSRNDNGVYVLDADTLQQVGRVTGLAPGEQLYAVRFVGDMAYLVTFLRTDPLFAVDLSDPAAPVLRGELVIPGFSNYLQPVGDGLLLGIGQEQEAGTWRNHVHASLFDVSDPSNPVQVDRQFLDGDGEWSWSQAQFDHHAVLYSAQDGLLVVPVDASGYDAQTGAYHYGQSLKLLRVGPDGITELGSIATDEPVIRTVRIGDVLYAVSDNHVTAYNLADFSTPVQV